MDLPRTVFYIRDHHHSDESWDSYSVYASGTISHAGTDRSLDHGVMHSQRNSNKCRRDDVDGEEEHQWL